MLIISLERTDMRATHLFLTAAAAAFVASAASAQSSSDQSQPMNPPPAAAPANSAPLGSADHPIPQNSPTPPDQAFHLKAGDPNVVSNAPVPDTPSNRSAYGQPMSMTGKKTAASGD
jgi:hypothetical protein